MDRIGRSIGAGFVAAALVALGVVPAGADVHGVDCGLEPIHAVDTGTGCMLIGQTGTVQDPCCQYYAPSDEPESVFAVTRDSFDIWVVRQCPVYPSSCTPKLESDHCTPASDNTCEPFRDANGNPITVTRTIYLMQVTDDEAGNEWLAEPYRGKIHPKQGELVTVKFGNQGGRSGVISAGQDEAIMNALGMQGGLPLPEEPPVGP
jgi:hypothetical protein